MVQPVRGHSRAHRSDRSTGAARPARQARTPILASIEGIFAIVLIQGTAVATVADHVPLSKKADRGGGWRDSNNMCQPPPTKLNLDA